jgi:hypothetical protein
MTAQQIRFEEVNRYLDVLLSVIHVRMRMRFVLMRPRRPGFQHKRVSIDVIKAPKMLPIHIYVSRSLSFFTIPPTLFRPANMLVTPPAGVAMPIIKTLTDCASYSTTVEPYIPQLYALPEQILANIGDLEALKNIYASTNPIISGFAFSLALFPIFLVVSEVNRNWSQVDRVWSILPTLYHIHYAVWARMNGLETQRVDNVMAFSVLWSIRLTFNYWRRGGYQIGSEDYRWNLIKGWIGTPAFFILNILFTSSVQSVRSSLPTHLAPY